jgi:hypothetical protein
LLSPSIRKYLSLFICCALLTALSFPSIARAVENQKAKNEAQKVQWGGVIFAYYKYMLGEEANGHNEFDIVRGYLSAQTQLNQRFSAKVQTDVGREKAPSMDTDGDGSADIELSQDEKIRLFLKNAYLQWAVSDEVDLRFGVAGTGFTSFYDKFWGQRYIAKSFTDDNKLLDSADIGVHALGKHADGFVSWQASFINGEGYDSAEIDAAKTIQARFTLNPTAHGDHQLPVTVFVSQDVMTPDSDNATDPVTVLAPAVAYANQYLKLWAEVVIQRQADTQGFGYSATVMPTFPDVLNLIARFDVWDPDADTMNDDRRKIIAGVSHDFLKKVSAALTYERTTQEAEPDAPEHGIFVHMQAGF